jgi:hemolysin activation/secretion protein
MQVTPATRHAAGYLAAFALLLIPLVTSAQVDAGDGALEQPLGSRRSELSDTDSSKPQAVELAPVTAESAPPGAARFVLYAREFRFVGNTVISTEQLQAVATAYQGREITDAELQDLRRKLTALYTDAGYIASGIVIPDQDIVDGVVTLQAVEGRLGQVQMTGVRQFDEEFLRNWITSGIDAPIRARQLEEHLLTMLQDPAIAGLKPQLIVGDAGGTSVLRVDVTEARQYGARIGVANDRSPALGGTRGELELLARNLLGRGDFTSVSLEASQGLQVVDARTDVPLNVHGTRLQFRFADYDSRVTEKPLDVLNIESETRIVELGLQQTLYRGLRRTIAAGVSLDGRDSDSFLDGIPFSFSPGAERGRVHVRAARFRLSWLERGERDVFSVQALLSAGLDLLNATVHDDTRPDSEFLTGLLATQWLHAFGGPWGQLYSRFQIQKSGDSLLPLEKMAIGGTRSVRGYRRARLIRDSAWDASIEYRVPLVNIPIPGVSADGEGRFSAVVFVDAGRAWNEDNGRDFGNRSLIGAGPGLRWDVSRSLRAEFYWAGATRNLHFVEKDMQDRGLHFQVEYQTQF